MTWAPLQQVNALNFNDNPYTLGLVVLVNMLHNGASVNYVAYIFP